MDNSRRAFIQKTGALLVPGVLGLKMMSCSDDILPNILWITCEDMSPALGCYNDAYADTPKLDQLGEIVMYELPEHRSTPTDVQDRYALDLAPLGLVKGDELKIILQAVDYRGRGQEGRATLTEPLLFQVTDERGILAAMSETDRESAGRLKTMIQRQIEVGEGQ